jgi:hypothetical protein
MDPDESTAERSGPAPGAASGESTHVGPRFSPDLTARPPAPAGPARTATGGSATLDLPADARPAAVPPGRPGAAPAPPPQRPPATLSGAGVDVPGGWPNIADYWPDAPQRMGPPADVQEEPGAAPTRIGAAWQEGAVRAAVLGRPAEVERPRRRGRVLAGIGLAVLLLSGGGFIAYKKVAQESRLAGPPSVASAVPVPEPGVSGAMGPAVVLPEQIPSKTATTPAQGAPARPESGTFWLVDDVSNITIRTAKLDRGIVEVGRPDGSDARPRTTVDGGDVKLRLAKGGRRTDLDVRLDSRVEWAIRLGGGARSMTVDLGGGEVRSVTFDGGAARIDLRLPRLGDTLPIAMNGGVNQWRISTRGRVKVRVVARDGAGRVVLYGRDLGGMRRGERAGADGGAGIDVDASAGFGSLTVAGD